MSHSRQKTPITGWCCCRSEKTWKQFYHRRYRTAVKMALKTERRIPDYREYSEPYWWGKDGKSYFGDMFDDHRPWWDGCTRHDYALELMRK